LDSQLSGIDSNSLNLIFDLNITDNREGYAPHVITDLFNGLSFKYSNNSIELKETSETVLGRN
jgi:hypothetical protein